MKVFRQRNGAENETMTVAELREILSKYPDNMPLIAEWEGVTACIGPESISVEYISKGNEAEACYCLVFDVNAY